MQGYSAEEIERLKSQPYTILNNNGITAYEHTEKFTYAASFYDNAEEEKQYLLDEYSSDAGICADISARYDSLINDYRAFCDYDLAYTSIQYVIANAFPFTVGVPVLIGLAPLFARERARKTDALILSSKRGRRDTARAKICAGTLYTLLVWSVMAISAAAYCFILYGAEGFGAFWQSFTGISSPFRWTIGQAIIVELATSLIGTLFFACIVMLLSELTESMFVSVILGAALLLTPMLVSIGAGAAILLPTCLIRGVMIWSVYIPAKLFGSVMPAQYLAVAAAAVLSIACCTAAANVFCRRQAA